MRSRLALRSVALLASTATAQSFQSWNELDLNASWHKGDFLVSCLARIDGRLANPQLVATGLEAGFAMPWSLTVTGGYLFADQPQRSRQIHLPLAALTKSWQVGRLRVIDRNRFEKLMGYSTSPVRYRNRLLFDRPLGIHDRWHLFVDDEIIVDFSTAHWNQNRFQAGGGRRLSRRLLLDVYYLRRDLSAGAPTTEVLGAPSK